MVVGGWRRQCKILAMVVMVLGFERLKREKLCRFERRLQTIAIVVNRFAQARDCLLPMGITSENVAERYGVTRQEQDQAAVTSHKRAAAATASGKFRDEIVPVSTKIVDPRTGEEKPVTISVDDGIRPNTNLTDLAKLKPAFNKNGSTTAGNKIVATSKLFGGSILDLYNASGGLLATAGADRKVLVWVGVRWGGVEKNTYINKIK
ncbi:3-ketoacyl-CoA thiolase 1 [Abeliophyllum distichum]|uniref:3-ketoacyl-CoA thiolase 1 n=1 Tax=Abeliophyllum distichum TaxID=126358 RepID=A0ABD1TWF9_9LAMI